MAEFKLKRRARHAVKEHLPKWMLDCAVEAEQILAAAPYVTDERLFKKCDPKVVRLYTDFSALIFISGASSLKILKRIVSRGVTLFHLDSLHAKVVMIDGKHFSLGSQNLTVRGRRKNVEASFVAGSETPPDEVRKFFELIHQQSRPVSLQEIIEMEKLIEPWIKMFKEVQRGAEGIDQFLKGKRDLREKIKLRMKAALEKRKREEDKAKKEAEYKARREADELARKESETRAENERSERMKRALSQFDQFFGKQATNKEAILIASVRKLVNPPRDIMFGRTTYTDSLVPIDRERNFSQLLEAVGIVPRRYYRYLLVDRTTGKLGFVRFAKGQWTFFSSGVLPTKKVTIENAAWNIEINFDWRASGNRSKNGDVHLYITPLSADKRIRIASAGFALSVQGVEMEELVLVSEKILVKWRYMTMVRDLDPNKAKTALQAFLLPHLTKPFKFSHNRDGKQALDFFGRGHPVTYKIQAHRFGDTAIFSAEQYPPVKTRPLEPNFLQRVLADF